MSYSIRSAKAYINVDTENAEFRTTAINGKVGVFAEKDNRFSFVWHIEEENVIHIVETEKMDMVDFWQLLDKLV